MPRDDVITELKKTLFDTWDDLATGRISDAEAKARADKAAKDLKKIPQGHRWVNPWKRMRTMWRT